MGKFSDRKSADALRIVRTLVARYKRELFPSLNFQHQQFVDIFFVLPNLLPKFCYFGSTVFSKKVLKEITGKVIQRSDTSYGSGRYRVLEEFL